MRHPRRRKRRLIDAELQSRLVIRSVAVIVFSTVLFSIGFLAYYWGSYIAGDNLFREFIIVYKQIENVDDVEIRGRQVQQRSYSVEAQPETARWRLILPPLLINNLLIAIVLSLFAVWYSHRIAGPIYRIRADLRLVLGGQRGVRIVLRQKDELRELSEQVNRLLEELEAAESDDEWVASGRDANPNDGPPSK